MVENSLLLRLASVAVSRGGGETPLLPPGAAILPVCRSPDYRTLSNPCFGSGARPHRKWVWGADAGCSVA